MNSNALNVLWRKASSQNNVFLKVTTAHNYRYVNNSTKAKGDTSSSSSSSSSDSDIDLPTKPDPETTKAETVTKLNNLLQQLIQNDEVAKSSKLQLAKPKNKRIPKEERGSKKVETIESKLVKAVTDVAKDIGGDTKQTESELLSKLLGPSDSTPSSKSLNDIVKGMTIDRESKSAETSRAEQIRKILQNMQGRSQQDPNKVQQRIRRPVQQYRPKQEMVVEKINLFGSKPLGIFTNKDLRGDETKTWQKLYERDLKLAVTHPPSNYFQQMILWTEQGKLWKFPIDNEQGMEEEQKVDFAKHIFLEEHLESWCPAKGPIRHYMELVCVGLSKNPYLTVEAKIEHIEWYKNYFEEKKKLLQEVGAFPADAEAPTQKQID